LAIVVEIAVYVKLQEKLAANVKTALTRRKAMLG